MRTTWLPCALAAMLAGPVHAGTRPVLPVFADAASVTATCDAGLKSAETAFAAFAKAGLKPAATATALRDWDRMAVAVEDFAGPIEIAASVATDAQVREAADACGVRVANMLNGFFQNADALQRINAVKGASGPDRELQKVLKEGFEDSGVALPDGPRQRARAILDRLAALEVEFSKNTREDSSTITVTRAELEGLPQSYIDKHKPDAEGRYVLSMSYPDYMPFMENAVSGGARQRYFVAFFSVGGERNLAIMAEAMSLRKELAGLFGKPSFADYVLQRRMAGSPANVHRFLDQVKAKVTEVERTDLEVLRQAKAAHLKQPLEAVKVERWDTQFYLERVRRERFAVDQEALRSHFPTEPSVAWMFDLAERLYGIRFVAAEVPRWHEDVRYYDVIDERGQRIAGAYLDLYPRPGKYNHAAVWPVRHGSTLSGRTPIGVLVANLDRKGLNHRELETLLHEFGHLLHGNLSRTRYASLSGTSVRRDFVEAPSQMLEEWTRDVGPLSLLRKHCTDCAAVDQNLMDRINSARRFGAGIHYARQHMLASFDMAMASPAPGEPLATWAALEQASPLGHVAGTRFPARFGHLLGGYASGYYGYMWAEVLALDMASRWNGNLLDGKVGRRYRDIVLARGGEVPPDLMVREFLGRAPSSEPFFAEISGKHR